MTDDPEREYAKHLAADKPDQYTFSESPDGGWTLITDDGHVADWGPR
jgi:hypothetical protein